jgi:hypothetical protein
MHPLWLGWKAIGDGSCSSQPDVQALGAGKKAVVRFFALAFIGKIVAGPTSEYLPAIQNGNTTPTSSGGT